MLVSLVGERQAFASDTPCLVQSTGAYNLKALYLAGFKSDYLTNTNNWKNGDF